MARKGIWAAMFLVAASIVIYVASSAFSNKPSSSPSSSTLNAPSATSSSWTNVLVPDHATDGTLTIVIPDGAAAEMDAGNPSAVQLPPVMHLKVGDRIVIENHDSRPHLVMYAYVLPGATNERVMQQPDIEVYSAGCSVNASASGAFMTMVVEK